MYLVKQTDIFLKWLKKLKDIKGKVTILRRIDRAKYGNFGDYKYLGDGVNELRVDFGPGYRVYFSVKNSEIIILLIGGDKSTQNSDIKRAKEIFRELENE